MMDYGMGPKETAAVVEAIKSNIPDGWTVERFADGFSVWSRSPERMVGNMKRRADGWIAYSHITDRAEWFRYIVDAALWVSEQHGEWMANVSHRMAEGFTWSIRQCLPPPLDVDPLTPRRSDRTFRPPLEWGIRDGAGTYLGGITHVGVDRFFAACVVGKATLTRDTRSPAEAATWIVEQLKNANRWGRTNEV